MGLAACSGTQSSNEQTADASDVSQASPPAATPAPTASATSTAPTPAAVDKPAPTDVATLSGAKFADFTGDPAKGKTAFVVCSTCHAVQPGANRIGPTLHQIVGRQAGIVPGYNYSAANKNSGITWTREKLFQYLEKPQRVVPGTKMTYPGMANPQQRADVIAYLATV
ncbi:MAG: cytochrome C [Proteobacteria bacterium SG_bin6]|nr:MAG: cytochrome C [Proteobacteria bacterium SG_bin6]